MKQTNAVTAALMSVALTTATFADGNVYSFPAPERIQVEDFLKSFLSIAGPPKVTELRDFCELNKEQFEKRMNSCSAEAWIEKDQLIMVQL
jgi:hypothetical protein